LIFKRLEILVKLLILLPLFSVIVLLTIFMIEFVNGFIGAVSQAVSETFTGVKSVIEMESARW
jgi:hypothetical protein